ncbi:complex i intermediate-associated protein 30 [Seminavis robusta]|uniref:Complex i intermediate-associated protein 30 n=1 Tax=Seminavis robusta TaxID=568900 RepID=A0A9N8HAB8_9STRA|nr:complex i intermediate-associated protein 30 [Seminavis robusta]|eukprot:Sro142_g066390.1 complex i intermediate-associated protein 30 (284) ;mRNA; f:91331-92430
MKLRFNSIFLVAAMAGSEAFQVLDTPRKNNACRLHAGSESADTGENEAMSFLRKIGKVGGVANVDFTNVMGVDEGPAGKTIGGGGTKPMRKAKSAYTAVTVDGLVDDLSEPFPVSSSGTQWAGFTDQVMGGRSSGSITREVMDGKLANVLRGKVSLENNGGFVQMATDLALDPSVSRTVDMSNYDGVELEVIYKGDREQEDFNIHLKNDNCDRQFSSYRGTFSIPNGEWTTVRMPFSDFIGKGPGAEEAPFDPSTLRRIGVVAIGREMEVTLGLAGLKFYSVL